MQAYTHSCTHPLALSHAQVATVAEKSAQKSAAREPERDREWSEFLTAVEKVIGGAVDRGVAQWCLEVARSSACSCACLPRHASDAALALQDHDWDVPRAADAYCQFYLDNLGGDQVCMNVGTRT